VRRYVAGGPGAGIRGAGRMLTVALLSLGPAAAGAAAILLVRPEPVEMLLWPLVALAGLAGLAAFFQSWRAGRSAARVALLDAECRDLAQKCVTYLARARAAEGKVESLSIIREIHRTGNITGRPERYRGLLAVLAATSEASQAELFVPEGQAAVPALASVLRRLADGEFFAYLDKPLVSSKVGAEELICRRVEESGTGPRVVVRAEVCVGKDQAGFAELTMLSRGGEHTGGPPPREILEAMVHSLDLDPAGADQALEHRQVFRVHDQSRSWLTVSYPLMAEGAIIGSMRLRVPDEVLARRELSEVEELLQETAGHVGLVVKKDEDVERARRDGLTGLLLKVELLRELREELERRPAGGVRLSLLMIDIDHFKKVNDTFGHQTGDVVLKGVAVCIAGHVRSCDRAYRYGGEEMSVLLPGADEAAAARTAERLRRSVAELSFAAEDGRPVPVTISIGLCEATGGRADPDELIARADQALYHSKESGRDRCSAWRETGPEALPRGGRSGRRTRRDSRPAPAAGTGAGTH